MFEIETYDKEENGFIIKTAIVKYDDKVEEKYIKVPISEKEFLTNTLDPFVIMNIYQMMRVGGNCYIRGKVNSSLLNNLENFCNCWNVLNPLIYKKINIIADEEIDDKPIKLNNDAIMCFSGGLDSCHAAYSHFKGLEGRNNKNIKKALFLLTEKALRNDKKQLDTVLKNTKIMLDDLNIEMVVVDTNAQFFTKDWMMEYISVFTSCISIYKGVYSNGIIASADRFTRIDNTSCYSFSNNFLGSNNFKILTTGEFLTRTEKANVIKDWKIGLEYLRVCIGTGNRDKNCGICEKCQRTMLNFKVCGIDNIPSFSHSSINLQNIILTKIYQFKYYYEILEYNKITNHLDNNSIKQIVDLLDRSKAKLNSNENIYETILNIDKKIDKIEKSSSMMNNKINKIIDSVAWWIPIKKWRDNFKNKLKI